MIAVIFEVIPHADKKQAYLDMAAEMKPWSNRSTASCPSSDSRASPIRRNYCRSPSFAMKPR